MSTVQALFKTITEPMEFFDTQFNRSAWAPIFLFVVLISAAFGAYYFTADPQALAAQLSFNDPSLSKEEREMAQSFLSPSVLFVTSTLSTIIQVLIMGCIFAGYFLILSNLSGAKTNFSYWFAITLWGMVPFGLDYLSILMNIVLSKELVPVELLNPSTLNALLLHLPLEHPYAAIASTISIGLVWTVVHLSVAYSKSTNKSVSTSAVIVAAPVVVMFGIWFLMVA